MSEPWEDFQPQGATTADAPSPETPPWEDFKPVPLSDEAKAGLVQTAQKEAQRKAALGLPFAEVQPNGEVIQRAPDNNAEANLAEFKSLPGRVAEDVRDTATDILNYPVELWRADTGTPMHGVVKTGPDGKEILTEEPKPLPFQAGRPVVELGRSVLQPEGNQISRLIEGFLTPENIATFPFMAAKPVQAYFLAQTAPGAVQAATKLIDPNTPEDQRHEAATDLLVNGLMSYGLAHGLSKTKATDLADALNQEPGQPSAVKPPSPMVETVNKNPWDDFKQPETPPVQPATEPKTVIPPKTVEEAPTTFAPAETKSAKSETVQPVSETKTPDLSVPEQAAKETGYKFVPGRQIGAVKLEGLTDEERAQLEAMSPIEWEFTHPKTGITFYMPEGASKEDIIARAQQKDAEFKAKSSPPPEEPTSAPTTPPAEPAAPTPETSAAGEIVQPDLLAADKSKPVEAQIIQLRRMADAAEQAGNDDRLKAINTRIIELQKGQLEGAGVPVTVPKQSLMDRINDLYDQAFPGKDNSRTANYLHSAITKGEFNDMLRPANKVSRRLFAELTGIKLPPSERDTKKLFQENAGKPFPLIGEPVEKPATPPTPIDKTPPEAQPTIEEQDETGQPQRRSPEMDVREPAPTGSGTPAVGETGTALGGQEPASPQAGGEVQGGKGNVRGRGVSGRKRSDTGAPGRPSDVAVPAEAAPVEGTGGSPSVPRSGADLNHVLPQNEDYIPTGDKAKVRANLDAIKLLKKLEQEQRNPTPEEKAVLARYTGWGGLKEVFDTGKAAYRERPPWNPEQQREFQNWEKSWGKLYDEVASNLTDEEHAAAARSILNAHYTSREIINGLWKAVQHLGFKGGNALEPASGVGHFIGLTPEALRGKTKWKAVELDSISGRIAAKLYPEAHVQNTGFQDAKIPNNSQDLVISNFPFAADGPTDKRYPNFSLHNYFFARSLDLVKPGGIVAAITSDSTMDSAASRKAREYMAEKADLVGAIRLPNTAFKKNAGTEVTTDILFFRKRTSTPFQGAQDFVRTVPAETYKGEPITINEYFANHPEMMLGRMSKEGTMYRAEQQALLPTPGKDLNEQISQAIEKLPRDVFGAERSAAEPEGKTVQAAAGSKVGGLVIKDGVPYRVEADGSMVKPDWATSPAKITQAKRYVELRDMAANAIREMLDPNGTDAEIELSRQHLNRLYDDYRKRHGAINERPSAFLDDDVDFPLALALEDANTKTIETPKGPRRVTEWTKSKIFSERTLFPRNAPAKVDTVPDALQVSMNYAGKVDPEYMAQLTGRTPESVKAELRTLGTAFENPATGHWETRAEYLSGFVKDKLKEAIKAAQDDPNMLKNVAELEKVQPAPIAMENIGFRLGSRWIPESIIEDFIREVLHVKANVSLTERTGDWHVNAGDGVWGERNRTVYGIHDWKGHELVEAALNLKAPKVTMVLDGPNGKTEVKDGPKTLEAEAKQQELQNQFKKYVATHPDAARLMEQIYNERHNGVVAPKFEPPTWAHYPGASSDITLREHQKAVVSRMLQNSTLLAHAVGTGKTYAMITAAMEMRRLGLAKKPMIVVQNATLEQFARSFKRLYPTARILVPNAKARDALNRNKTMSRIATGDWDAVIIPQSFVNMLPDDPVRETKWLQDQIDQLEQDRIEAARSAGKRSPKAADLQRAIGKLEDRLTALADRKKDNVLNFEQLGVDALFVDEAHAYKKLQFTTKMDSIKGLDTGASQRGLSMMFKARWVQEKNQGRNVTFATGTPVSNTIAEAYTMMRYLRPDVLKKYHIEDFDSFAGTFGDTITGLEMTATGNWKPVTRFARYTNGPELISAWRTVADVVTPEEINLPGLPALKNGKTTAITIPQTKNLAGYIRYLQSELERFAKMSGKEKRENSHIPLVVFGRAKKASLDMRMIDPDLPDEPSSKLNVAADNITRIYKESEKNKGTQMVFSDSFQDNPEAPRFNLYNALRDKLIERGIPADKIAIITADIKDAKREALFQKVNDGDIRVVIGSTERMGVGVNAQERMVGLHHLDAPPRPMDIEQRNGRILRQGNSNPVVEIVNYGVENTLDAAMYQKLATKQKFINQILRGDISGRNFEDAANEQSLSFEEQMAAFSGDKRAMEKVALENQVRQLQMLRSGHFEQVRRARETIDDLEKRQIPYNLDQIASADKKASEYENAFKTGAEPRIQVGDRVIIGKKEATPILDTIFKQEIEDATKAAKKLGKFGSTASPSRVAFTINGKPVVITALLQANEAGIIQPEQSHVGWRFEDSNSWHNVKSGDGFFMGIKSDLEAIARDPAWQRESLASKERNLTELKGFVQQPFEREAELQSSGEKLTKLNAELEDEGKTPPPEPPPGEEPPTEHIGMGAAVPAEFQKGQQTPTSTKNATIERERASRGLPPAIEPARRSFGTVWDSAMAAIDQDPAIQDNLINSLRAKPRAITDFENALLLHRQIELQNEYGKLTQEIAHAYDDAKEFPNRMADVEELKPRIANVLDRLFDIYEINKAVGTETGRGLNARKMMAYEDYTLAQMELDARAANGGRPLTEEEHAQVKALHDKIDKLRKEFDAYTTQAQSRISQLEAENALAEVKAEPPVEPHVRLIASKIKTYFDGRAVAAQKRLSGKTFSFEAALPDLIDLGVSTILSGAADFTIWSSRMLEKLDKSIEPHLKTLWDKSNKALDEHIQRSVAPQNVPKVKRAVKKAPAASPKEQIQNKIRARVESGRANEISGYVRKLARMYLEDGITDRNELIDAIHSDLKEIDPTITRRETMDAISGYGDFKQLSKDEISKELRDLKGQMQQVAKLEDMQAGQPPLKTGIERRIPSKEESRLIKLVNEAKRKFQIPITDPTTQLKSALDTLKTRMQNRIEELQEKIAEGDFAPKPKREPLKLDEQARRIRADYERAKLEFERELQKYRLKNRKWWEKSADTVVKWRRGFILSSPVTLAKLFTAALQRMAITPAEEAIGGAIGAALPRVAAKAKRESGLNTSAEAKAITDAFTKGMADAAQTLKTGMSELDVLYGHGREGYVRESMALPRSVIDFFGNLHGALKAPVKRAEFARSFEKRTAAAIRDGVDVTDPMVQTRLAVESYKDANRSIFLQDNYLATKVRMFFAAQKKKGEQTIAPGAKAWETTGKILLPIVRVPTNIVAETFTYAFGLGSGSLRLANALRKGFETLEPEQADLIMRELKKGSLGAAALLYGYFNPNMFGGYYQPGQKRDQKDVKFGSVRVGGHDIPSFLVHNPLLEVLQLGATVRRVADSKVHGETKGLGAGLMGGLLGLTDEIPFVREMFGEIPKMFNPNEQGAFWGELLKSIFVPQVAQWLATYTDKDQAGNTVPRSPQTVLQHVETGLPGLRKKVPNKKPTQLSQ